MQPINTRYTHSLNPDKFSPYVADALRRLLTGDWNGFGAKNAVVAINALHEILRQSVGANGLARPGSTLGLRAAHSNSEELRRCIHSIAEVWALSWYNRGEFDVKLAHYLNKSSGWSLTPIDQVYLSALEQLGKRIQAKE